jgi:hypothetical protein
LAAASLSASDLSGKWVGTMERLNGSPGGVKSDDHFLTLQQSGDSITGTAGPKRNVQWEIKNARLDGSKLTFEVSAPGGQLVLAYTLEIADDGLAGTVDTKIAQDIHWKLRVKRE